MDKKKRQQFSLKEKREILLEVEKGGKKERDSKEVWH